MDLRALFNDPTERRNSLIALALIATAVAVLAFGAGPGSILRPSAAHGATPGDTGLAPGVMTAETEPAPPSSGTGSNGDGGDDMAMGGGGAGDSTDGGATSPSASTTGEPAPATCPALADAVLTPFVVHFKAAHLERSPSEQATDLTNVDQYTKTHTVLFENMLDPIFRLMLAAPDGLDPFVVHFRAAHTERSPAQQVADASNADQYTKTHTVLFENMLDPTLGVLTGTTGC
jgi:hypothetical protein